MNRILLSLLTILALSLVLWTSPAAADSGFRMSELPSSLRYLGSRSAAASAAGLHYRHRSQQFQAVEAPTRYRTKSILRYSKALGKSGMRLRVKAPLKPRKIIKVELQF